MKVEVSSKTLVVIDGALHSVPGAFADLDACYLLWSDYSDTSTVHSLPELVERDHKSLRKRLVDLIHDISKLEIHKTDVVGQMGLRAGMPYWWMTLLNEKSPYKSDWIYDLLRLFCLEDFLSDHTREIVLYSSSKRLHHFFKQYAGHKRVVLRFHRLKSRRVFSISYLSRRLFDRSPHICQAAVSLVRYVIQYRSMFCKPKLHHQPSCSSMLVGYFPNMDMKKAKSGVFQSNYWCGLPTLLKEKGVDVDWLFIFGQSPLCTPAQAMAYIDQFNCNDDNGRYVLLQQFFDFKVLLNALADYAKMIVVYYTIIRHIKVFLVSRSPVYFSLLKNDLKRSMIGKEAIHNTVTCHLMRAASGFFRGSQSCYFLMENQPWEKALGAAWKHNSDGPLYGYIHSSVRDMDTRCYGYQHEFQSGAASPSPTKILYAGDDALMKMNAINLSSKELLPVESLRYNYLINTTRSSNHKRCSKQIINIYVFTDILEATTSCLFRFMRDFIAKYADTLSFNVFVKPHPFLMGLDKLIHWYMPRFPVKVVTEPLSNVNSPIDVGVVYSSSGVALDLAYRHIPFGIVHDPSNLNISPLMAYKTLFLYNVSDFIALIMRRVEIKKYLCQRFNSECNYYYLDSSLFKWSCQIDAMMLI